MPQKKKADFLLFQLVVMEATKQAIFNNAEGLRVDDLKKYMTQLGGDLQLVFGNNKTLGCGNCENNPFRLRIEVIEKDTVQYVKKVWGWG